MSYPKTFTCFPTQNLRIKGGKPRHIFDFVNGVLQVEDAKQEEALLEAINLMPTPYRGTIRVVTVEVLAAVMSGNPLTGPQAAKGTTTGTVRAMEEGLKTGGQEEAMRKLKEGGEDPFRQTPAEEAANAPVTESDLLGEAQDSPVTLPEAGPESPVEAAKAEAKDGDADKSGESSAGMKLVT